MRNIFTITALILLGICFTSCKEDNPVISPVPGNGEDTTSHNFTFQTWTFGEHSSSTLYDAAIIDDNNIWAVGEIYLNDSTGQPDPQPYAVAHWNGTEWELMKVSYHDYNQTVKYPGPLFSVTSINGEIYSVSYANLLKWTGTDWIEKAFFIKQIPFEGQVLKIWGNNENNIICVGRNGAIYKYFGSDWEKIESGTDLNIYDIQGKFNNDNRLELYAVAANQGVNTDNKILKIQDDLVTNLSVTGINSSIKGIWFKPGEKYYVVGSGIFTKTDIYSSDGWLAIWQGVTESYTGSIDGNDLNDIVVCGSYGEMLHYNGNSWKSFKLDLQLQSSTYGEVKIKNNLIIAVGHKSSQAVISIGRRP